jgi:signal transduction histidine kinase
MNASRNRRLLLVDDMPAIHEDFRKILVPHAPERAEFSTLEAALFGDEAKAAVAAAFELDSAFQGQEGLAKVEAALAAERPYATAFIDMRMPPGWDGVETIARLWQVDPRLQIVICTAYADYSWNEVLTRLDVRDRLLILKKPFDAIEVCQLANTLTAKWEMTQQATAQLTRLEEAVRARTRELTRSNEALQAEISERKHLQGQLVQAEKLASIGQLAAGVAHEINNPIGFMLSNVRTLRGYLKALLSMISAQENAQAVIAAPDVVAELNALRKRLDIDFLKDDIPSLLQETNDGIVRVQQIVQDLRDFSQIDATPDWCLADLHRGIDSTLNIVGDQVNGKADIVKDYGVIPQIECLPSQINQVVMNLVVNAAQAIGAEQGTITIRTGTDGDQVWIEIADNGSGISEAHLSRIFDPFFTTKPVGKGTGLGLSLSYGIVQKHQGRIEVHSEVGQGTCFRVVLPVRRSEGVG